MAFGFIEAFKNVVHDLKKKADPKYDGKNPGNEEELKRDLEKLGIVSGGEKELKNKLVEQLKDKWGYDEGYLKDQSLMVLRTLCQAREVGITDEEMSGRSWTEIQREVKEHKTGFKDTMAEELRQKLPENILAKQQEAAAADLDAATADHTPSTTKMSIRQELILVAEAYGLDRDQLENMNDKQLVESIQAKLKQAGDRPGAAEIAEPDDAEKKLDLAIKEFGLGVSEVKLEAGKLTGEIRGEIAKARRRAAKVSTPDEYWKTLDSKSLAALDDLHKRGLNVADLRDRLIEAGASYGLSQQDLRAITDTEQLRKEVYETADQIIDEAMERLPLAERQKVRGAEAPVAELKQMLDKLSASSTAEELGSSEKIRMHAASKRVTFHIDPKLPEHVRKMLMMGINAGLSPEDMQGTAEEIRKAVTPAVEAKVTQKNQPEQAPAKPIQGLTEAEKDMQRTRNAADITFARLMKDEKSKFSDLNPDNPAERDERFLEKTRALWKEFAVHGICSFDKKTGKPIILKHPDLDGRTCLGLLTKAGIDTSAVEFVRPGEAAQGRINLDTGYKNGLVVENEGETAYFDHHGPDNGNDTSAAKVTYEVLTKLGLLKPEEHLDRLVEFVTRCDNKTHPTQYAGFKDSYRTMIGLFRFVKFYQLEQFFREGRDPAAILTDEDIKRFGLEQGYADQKAAVEQSEARLKEMQEQGLIIDSKQYGKIVVDIGRTLRGGVDAVGNMGGGCYIIWNPDTQSFFLSTVGKPLVHSFGQGKKIRGTMWIKEPHDKQPLKLKLSEVLSVLAGQDFAPAGELKAYLEREQLTGPESKAFDRAGLIEIGVKAGLVQAELDAMSDADLVKAVRSGWEQHVAESYEKARLNGGELPAEATAEISEAERLLTQSEAAAAAPPAETVVRPEEGLPAEAAKTININGHVIDISEIVKNLAFRQAEQQMTELLNKSGFMKKWWLRMSESGQLFAKYREALNAISGNKVLLTTIEARMLGKSIVHKGDDEAQIKLLDAVLEAYEKDLASADEKGQLLVNPEVHAKLSDLFYRHAKGEFTNRVMFDQAFNSELGPMFEAFARDHKEMFTSSADRTKRVEGLMFAQNFWHLAESYKDRISEVIREHGSENEESVRNYLNGVMNIDIRLGLKQKELYNNQPEGKLKMMETLTDKLESLPFGLGKVAANPVAFGAIGSVFGQMGARAGIKAGAMAGLYLSGTAMFFAPTTAALLAGGLAGGAFMWYRRSRDLKYDRGMDARRMALGELSGGKRTDKIREYGYEMKSAQDLTDKLNMLASQGSLSDEERAEVADVIARLSLEKKLNVDLVSVSEQAGKEGMRILEMNPLLASLKQVKDKFGLSEDALRDLVGQKEDAIIDSINSQDKRFESFRRWESAKAGIIGGAMGVAGGLLSQWGIDQLRGHGLPGFDSQKHGSALEGAYHWLRGEDVYEHATGPLVAARLPGTGGTLNLPEGYELVDQTKGQTHVFGIRDSHGHMIASGLEANGDGQLTGSSLEQLKQRGFEIQDTARKIRSSDIDLGGVTKSGASVEDMQRWLPKLSEHARVDWHDEPGKHYSSFFNKLIEYEGKQQMLYLEKDPSGMVSINTEKVAMNLLLNARKAFAEYGTNPDGSVDTKLQHLMTQLEDWAKNGELGKHLQAAIIPTEEANKKGLSLLQEGTLPDGRLPLPREMWDMFKSSVDLHDGHLPIKYAELRLDGHVLATAQGHDLFGSGGSRSPIPPREMFVHDIGIRPPLDPDVPIPTPFFPRKQLEISPRVPSPRLPYSGYGFSSPEQIQARMEREHIELHAPEKTRSVERERQRVARYVESMDSEYRNELAVLERSLPPMDEKTRVAVNIPAYNEAPNLRRLLERYTKQLDENNQPLDPRLYEINVITNRPGGTAADGSADIINQFKAEHPEFKINIVDLQFPKEKAGVGLARKYITDLTLLRSAHRNNQEGPLYIQSEDADLLEVDPRIVRSVIRKFDEHPELDGLRGQQDRYPEIMMDNDILFLNRRAEDYWETLMRDKKFRPEGAPDNFIWNRVVTGGWNTAYTAEVYAQIGGYSPLKVGEDMDIGQRISMLRGSKKDNRIIPSVETVATVATRSQSSPRRYIDALARGIEPYSDFGNESVKFQTTGQLMERIKPYRRLDSSNTNQLERLLEGKYHSMIRDLVKDKEEAVKLFGRLMFHLGFRKEDWNLDDNDTLKIASISHVKKALNDYRKNPKYRNKLALNRGEGRRNRWPAGEVELERSQEAAATEPAVGRIVTETPSRTSEPASETQIRPSRAGGIKQADKELAGEAVIAEPSAATEKEPVADLKTKLARLDDPFRIEGNLQSVDTPVFASDLERIKDFGKGVKEYVDAVLTARYKTLEAKGGIEAKNIFGAYMDALGFRKDDWRFEGKEIKVSSIKNAQVSIASGLPETADRKGFLAAFQSAADKIMDRIPKKAALESLKKRGARVVRERFNLLKKTVDSYSEIRQKKDLAAMAEAENILTGIYMGLPEGSERKEEFFKVIHATGLKENQLKIDDAGNVTLSESVNQRQLMRKLKPNMFKKSLDAAKKAWEAHKKDQGI